jgi:hypothetical protein
LPLAIGMLAVFAVFPYLARPISAMRWIPSACTIEAVGRKQVPYRNGTTDHLAIRYSHEYAGRTYIGTEFSFDDSWLDDRTIDRIIAELPAGAHATCLVDPSNPARSVIRPKLSPFAWIRLLPFVPFAMGYVWLMVGIAAMLNPLRTEPISPAAARVSPEEEQRRETALLFTALAVPFTVLATLMIYIAVVSDAGPIGWVCTGLVTLLAVHLLLATVVQYCFLWYGVPWRAKDSPV